MESFIENFSSNIREYLEAIAKRHDISLSSIINEGIGHALVLLANKIDDDIIEQFSNFQHVEIIAKAKNQRIAIGKKKNVIDAMIVAHDAPFKKKKD